MDRSMEKQKKWQRYLIIAVIALTIYNILPTVFFYSKPLKAPIDAKRSAKVAEQIVERVNALEPQSKEWLASYCKLLDVKPSSVTTDPSCPSSSPSPLRASKKPINSAHTCPGPGRLSPSFPPSLTSTTRRTSLENRRRPAPHPDPFRPRPTEQLHPVF